MQHTSGQRRLGNQRICQRKVRAAAVAVVNATRCAPKAGSDSSAILMVGVLLVLSVTQSSRRLARKATFVSQPAQRQGTFIRYLMPCGCAMRSTKMTMQAVFDQRDAATHCRAPPPQFPDTGQATRCIGCVRVQCALLGRNGEHAAALCPRQLVCIAAVGQLQRLGRDWTGPGNTAKHQRQHLQRLRCQILKGCAAAMSAALLLLPDAPEVGLAHIEHVYCVVARDLQRQATRDNSQIYRLTSFPCWAGGALPQSTGSRSRWPCLRPLRGERAAG